jgi:4,5-DOPA dioxygenase extradiol
MLFSYVSTFDSALREAVTANSEQRQAKMAALMNRGDVKQAHPSAEHLMPLFVAAGAAGVDAGERVWTLAEGSLSWAQYRFGDVRKA